MFFILRDNAADFQRSKSSVDLGDRTSFYCVLNRTGEVVPETKVATNSEAMRKAFSETGKLV
jgi:hypothetical protein